MFLLFGMLYAHTKSYGIFIVYFYFPNHILIVFCFCNEVTWCRCSFISTTVHQSHTYKLMESRKHVSLILFFISFHSTLFIIFSTKFIQFVTNLLLRQIDFSGNKLYSDFTFLLLCATLNSIFISMNRNHVSTNFSIDFYMLLIFSIQSIYCYLL